MNRKHVFSLAIVLALAFSLWLAVPAQAAPDANTTLIWQSTSSTAWETPSNWYDVGTGTTSLAAPTSTDDVIIDGSQGATVNPIVSVSGQAAKSLTVGNGFVLTISGSATAPVLSVGDSATGNNDITIQNGGRIDNLSTVGTGNPFTLASTANDVFRIDAGGTYYHNTARSFGTPFPVVGCDFDPASTVEFGPSSSTSIAFTGRTYGNLTLSATSAKTYAASGTGAAFINGTLTLSSSFVTFRPAMGASSVSQTTTINNLVVTGGTFSPTASNAWVLVFTGNITNNGTITLPSSNLSGSYAS